MGTITRDIKGKRGTALTGVFFTGVTLNDMSRGITQGVVILTRRIFLG